MSRVSYIALLKELPSKAPVLCATVTLWLLAELFAVIVLPQVLPLHQYLQWYLSETAEHNFVEFTENSASFLEYDAQVGWRNRPGASFGSWSVASDGSRPASTSTTDNISPDPKADVVFLGSSLVNGGTHVANNETISSYVQTPELKTRNFGTMLYEVDQSILSFKTQHNSLAPAVVVLGLSADPGAGLSNRYLPFRYPAEENMPYFKPRYIREGGSLTLLSPPDLAQQHTLLQNDSLLRALQDSDSFYSRFSGFQFFGQLPLTNSAYYLLRKLTALQEKTNPDFPNQALLLELVSEFSDFLKQRNTALLLLLIPSQEDVQPSRFRKLFPDQYQEVLDVLRENKFAVLDAREALRRSNKPVTELYHPDGNHFTAGGNQVVASALRPKIQEFARSE